MKILLVSHGDFAAGLCSTVTSFFGASNVYSACVTKENGTADLLPKVQKYLEDWGDEQVVICSDIKGGSANQTVFPFISRPNTFLISGMNLPLVLQISMEDSVTAESLHDIIDSSKSDMVILNEAEISLDDDDE